MIPRNDTELLVWKVIEEFSSPPARGRLMVIPEEGELEGGILIDIWTWSSCIPISIIKNQRTKIKNCYAVDISKDALDVAKLNIKKHWLEKEIELINWDLLELFLSPPLAPPSSGMIMSLPSSREGNSTKSPSWRGGDLEGGIIITANLPYIKQDDFKNIDKQVYKNEPKLALYWGEKTGFELYEKLIKQCIDLKNAFLSSNLLVLFIEIGFDQKEVVKSFLENAWLKFEFFKDANKIDRVIKIFF